MENPTPDAASVRGQLAALADPAKAAFFPRFFKAGKGEYAEGDVFLGVTVPQIRSVVKRHRGVPLPEVKKLLADELHECRLAGVLILDAQFSRTDGAERKKIVDFYVSQLDRVNNWDIVDASAYRILGEYLADKPRGILYELAASGHLWRERVAVVSTLAFIRRGDFEDIFRLSERFLGHRHDLMHKACGWMLREAGKRDKKALERFLKTHAAAMPRTMLRYSIEKFPPDERKCFMGMRTAKRFPRALTK
jgi:3-methyladenine DNA glycosylase AlkD